MTGFQSRPYSLSATTTSTSNRPRSPYTISLTVLQKDTENDSKVDKGVPAADSRRRSFVATAAVTALISVSLFAKGGFLPGPPDGSGYTDSLIFRDLGATLLTATLGYLFVLINTFAVSKEWLEPRDSRKLIHTLSAPLFILFWPTFSAATGARAFAAIVPSLNGIRLYLASKGMQEAGLARAVSRSGNTNEALGGPFIYVIILAACILGFWRDSPVGVVALSCLAAGDGTADIVGRRFGKNNKWPGSEKSVAGSLAFWFASTLCAFGLLLWMQYWGCLTLGLPLSDLILRLAMISLAAAVLELAPTNLLDDNYSVPIIAAILAATLLQ